MGHFLRTALHDVEGVVLVAFAAWTGWRLWLWNVHRYPWKPCRYCEGKGKAINPVFVDTFGHCRICRGSGKRRRFGAWLLRLPDPSGRGRRETDRRR